MSYSTRKKISDDIIIKEFWRNNERFADLFNAVLFNGKKVINAENLQEIDTDVSGTIRVQEYKETLKRARDVVKKYYNGVEFNILGLEMQEKMHLAMPLRTMVYDALGYIKEYNEIKSNNTKDNIKRKHKAYIDNKYKDDDKTNTEYNRDFNNISKNYSEKSLSAELIDMISEMTGTKELAKIVNKGKKDKEDDVQMWSAMKEFRDSGVQEGRLEGKREGRLEGKLEGRLEGKLEGKREGQEEARLASIRTIMKKLNQTADEAMDTLDIEEKDRKKYRELINS